MIISVLQDAFRPGALEENFKKIKAAYNKAVEKKADMLVVPSEALCGFEPRGLVDYSGYSDKVAQMQKKLVRETVPDTALVFDTPYAIDGSFSPAIIVAYDGCVQNSIPHLPAEDFPDCVVEYAGRNILFSFFSGDSAVGVLSLPELMETVDLAVFLDARCFLADVEEKRCEMLDTLAHTVPALVYAGQAGGQETEILVGASAIYIQGNAGLQLPYFKPAQGFLDMDSRQKQGMPLMYPESEEGRTGVLHDALVCGIADYFKQSGVKKAVLGLSGGIDSSVVLPLAVEALGRANVLGLLMPSRFSSRHSVEDAVALAENLQVYYETIPIEPLYETFLRQLEPVFKNSGFGLAEENLQARIRGNLLMATANKTGGIVLNTTNKSEAVCGYGTLYGDLCGGIAVLGDLYKSQVYALARYINRKKEIIPGNCITKAPSAELRPGQKDSDSLPDYDLIEKIIRAHLEQKRDEKELIRAGFDKNAVKQVLSLFYKNEYKRRQAPPALRVSSTALCSDFDFPLFS